MLFYSAFKKQNFFFGYKKASFLLFLYKKEEKACFNEYFSVQFESYTLKEECLVNLLKSHFQARIALTIYHPYR